MGDSDNSTSLPSVTTCASEEGDLALALSLRWLEAHATTQELCARQQALETGPSRLVPARGGASRGAHAEALRAESDASARAEELLAELAQTPARSLAGAVAKCAVVLREMEDNTDLVDFPLQHIRSLLADLECLQGKGRGVGYGESPPDLIAWQAFQAWSQGDEASYRVWAAALKRVEEVRA